MNYYYVTRNNFIQIPLLEFNDRIVVIQYKRKKIINVVVINGLIFEEIDCNSYEFLYLRNLRTIRQRCRHLHDSVVFLFHTKGVFFDKKSINYRWTAFQILKLNI